MSAKARSDMAARVKPAELLDEIAHQSMLLGQLAQLLPDLPQDDPDKLAALADAMEVAANRIGWLIELVQGGSSDPLLWLVPERCRAAPRRLDAMVQGGAA